jgi:protease PrsW
VAVLIGLFLVFIFGIVPMLVYALVLWWFDRYEKEPLGLLVAAFLWGGIPAIVFSLIAQLVLEVPISSFVSPLASDLIGATVVAPVTEELFKGAALLFLLLFFRKEIDSPLDGIIYGGLVGFGFAAVENVFYFVGAFTESGLGGLALLTVFRAFLFGLNHALFTGLTGLGLALARTATRWPVKVGAPVVGLLLGMTAHGVHNGSVALGGELCWPCLITFASDWGGALVLVGVMIWASVQEQRWITIYLVDEVERGTLSQEDYGVVGSYVERLVQRMHALYSGDFKRWRELGLYHRLATELAFAKRRLARFPGEKDTEGRVVELREKVAAMTNE